MVAVAALGLWRVWSSNVSALTGNGEDPAFYAAVVQDMRGGASYYEVVGTHLRARGYAVASPFNHRLPTLALLLASFPSDATARGFLMALGCATLLLWYRALRPHTGATATFAALVLLSGLLVWTGLGRAYLVHETWAGVAIALSLALFALGHDVPGMLLALMALSLRELAMPHLLLSLVFAFRDGRRAPLVLGLVGLCAFIVGYAAHVLRLDASAGLDVIRPWLRVGGLDFLLKVLRMNFWLLAGPGWVTALALPLALVGLTALPSHLGRRVRGIVYGFAALFLVVGKPDNHLWGLLFAGPALVGIAFAPRALSGLWRRSFPPAEAS
jgi:hypothetical protein